MDTGRLLTAMVTPFDENDQIDWNEVTRITEMLIQHGSDGLVVAGTTGESPTLSDDEKESLFRHIVRVADGRAAVIAGTGSHSTEASLALTARAAECGVDGVMLVTPYYNKPSQEGLYHHFRTVAESTELPVMLYNVPGRTGVNMTADTVVRLAEIPNITSVKEASGDFVQATEIISRTPDDFRLYSGDDKHTLPLLAIGAHGVVSVASHIIGSEIKAMIEAFVNGDPERARAIHAKWIGVFEGMFLAPSPAPVKLALSELGYGSPTVRLPLVEANEFEKNVIRDLIKTVQLSSKNHVV